MFNLASYRETVTGALASTEPQTFVIVETCDYIPHCYPIQGSLQYRSAYSDDIEKGQSFHALHLSKTNLKSSTMILSAKFYAGFSNVPIDRSQALQEVIVKV